MQSTMDILGMMQKSSIAKQKSVTAGYSGTAGMANFKRELAEAKKNNVMQSSSMKSSEPLNRISAKDTKIEKLAKVMSSNKAATEKPENVSVETKEDNQKLTENKQETDALKVDSRTGGLVEEAKQEQDTALAELVDSAQELLEQLMQLINGTNNDNTVAQENLNQAVDSLQAITQKLEQLLTQTEETRIPDNEVSIKDLKLELKELIKQLRTQADATAVIVDKPSLQQKVDTIKQLINKLSEIKPILQQRHANPEVTTENTEQKPRLQEKQSKDINKIDNSIAEAKPKDENGGLKAAEESNAKESTDKDSKEPKHNIDSKETPKHQIKADKHGHESLKTFNALVNEKAGAQINVKELNLNQNKEQIVTINKPDFVNQVVKKADIIVREGHSEMVMKLEPESLGKLNLKIVVEKGLVTAKFIAESQQVKEVLESSFNQLKDALQEKGIAVQNFSVSVGQQTRDSGSNQNFDQWKQSLNIKNKTTGEFMGLDDETVISENPYSYHEGKFDYRA